MNPKKDEILACKIKFTKWAMPKTKLRSKSFGLTATNHEGNITLIQEMCTREVSLLKMSPIRLVEALDKYLTEGAVHDLYWPKMGCKLIALLRKEKGTFLTKEYDRYTIEGNPVYFHCYDKTPDELFWHIKITSTFPLPIPENKREYEFYLKGSSFKNVSNVQGAITKDIANLNSFFDRMADPKQGNSTVLYQDTLRRYTTSPSNPEGIIKLANASPSTNAYKAIKTLAHTCQKFGWNVTKDRSSMGVLLGWLEYWKRHKKPDLPVGTLKLMYQTYGWEGSKFREDFNALFNFSK